MFFGRSSKRRRLRERLKDDFYRLVDLCSKSNKIEYYIRSRKGKWPDSYEVSYRVKSIGGIKPYNNEPVYKYYHVVKIDFPSTYPIDPPACRMISDVWHPNIRYSGNLKGDICLNIDGLGPEGYTLDRVVLKIGKILQYKEYHALETVPYPYDQRVAKWIRDFAEPNDIVNKYKKIFVENLPLFDPKGNQNQGNQTQGGPRIVIRQK